MESTEEVLKALEDGTGDLSTISMQEYLQVAMIQATNNKLVHLEQTVVYGGFVYNVHMCMQNVQASESMETIIEGKH